MGLDDKSRIYDCTLDKDVKSIYINIYTLDVYDNANEKSRSIWWNDKASIEYEKEIPLAIQIITSSNEIRSFSGESFYEPDRLKDHDEVIALTVKFSTNELE